jgi:hypothetical protein
VEAVPVVRLSLTRIFAMVTPYADTFSPDFVELSREKNSEMRSTRARGAQSDSHTHIDCREDDGDVD